MFEQRREDRPLTINSLGEGAIWVCDINGALENGDYITSSLIPGVGMLQNDDLLHNYTVAKITMDCSFNEEQRPAKKLRMEAVEKEITTTDANGNETTKTVKVEQGVIDPITQQFVYDFFTDDSGNVVMVDKYVTKYIEVFADKYTIYNDKEKTSIFLEHVFDFAGASPEQSAIVGNTYKMAFVGCTYHCG